MGDRVLSSMPMDGQESLQNLQTSGSSLSVLIAKPAYIQPESFLIARHPRYHFAVLGE